MAQKNIVESGILYLNSRENYYINNQQLKIVFIVNSLTKTNIRLFVGDNCDLLVFVIHNKPSILKQLVCINGNNNNITIHFSQAIAIDFHLQRDIIIEDKGCNNNIVSNSINIINNASIFETNSIKVLNSSIGSVSRLTQRGLLLSKEANITFLPLLQIDSLETKSSHGSVIGFINEEEMFYLMSRGLNKSQAQELIIRSYFQPLVAQFSIFQNQILKELM